MEHALTMYELPGLILSTIKKKRTIVYEPPLQWKSRYVKCPDSMKMSKVQIPSEEFSPS